jgi:hypothetical protein
MDGSLLLSLGESLMIEQVSQEERHVIVSVRSTAASFVGMLPVLVPFLPSASPISSSRGHRFGVVEGHVHRLKLIKRMGYGRAGFPLLRQRVLHCV